MAVPEEHYNFLPLADARHPKAAGLFRHVVDHYWLVHPEKGLAFYNPPGRAHSGLGAPQCNTDPRIRELMADCPWPAELRKIASVFVPARASDYRRD
jgi:hypothetical protein